MLFSFLPPNFHKKLSFPSVIKNHLFSYQSPKTLDL
nr:MAG TPA: hypothetical protein [Bacteriophage sp.]